MSKRNWAIELDAAAAERLAHALLLIARGNVESPKTFAALVLSGATAPTALQSKANAVTPSAWDPDLRD